MLAFREQETKDGIRGVVFTPLKLEHAFLNRTQAETLFVLSCCSVSRMNLLLNLSGSSAFLLSSV